MPSKLGMEKRELFPIPMIYYNLQHRNTIAYLINFHKPSELRHTLETSTSTFYTEIMHFTDYLHIQFHS